MVLTGRAGLVALALAVVVAVTPAPLAALLVGDLVLLVLIGVDVLLAASPRRVHAERQLPVNGRLGEPLDTTLLLRNDGRRQLRGRVRDAWPPSAGLAPSTTRVSLASGERFRVTATLRPTRRGDRRARTLVVRALGPLGLAGRQRNLDVPGRVRVLPHFRSRALLPEKLSRLRQVEGLVSVRGAGRGTEFDSLREYVPGDDVRSIDWRATARRSAVAVRTYRPERDRRVVLVLDTGRTSAGRVGDEPRLDHALDAALLLSALAFRAGDRVDLIAHDAVPRAVVERASLASLSDAMALLEPALLESNHQATLGQTLRIARRRSLVVLFTDLVPAVVEESLLPSLAPLLRRHTVVIAALADPRVAELVSARGNVSDVYGAAAAERAQAERRRLAGLLRRRGVEVVDAPPSHFASAVADAYLALKAAGRL
ncbi:MAG: hypothetical protein QOC80_2742 [Frankiaceae bacterium]|nr:hypothetical protein [Frankiaceae bacterium]